MMARGAKFETLRFSVDGWNDGVGEPQMLAVIDALAPCVPLRGLHLGGDFLLSKTTCEAAVALRPAALTFDSKASPDLRGATRDAHVYWTAEVLRGVLPGLKQLSVYAHIHMPGVVLQALGYATPALEEVHVTLPNDRQGGAFEDVASVLRVMSTLPQLKRLSLQGGPSSSWPVPSAALDLGCLSSLTRLTELHVTGVWSDSAELAWRSDELDPELWMQFREAAEREMAGLVAAVQAMPSLDSLLVSMPLDVSDLLRLTTLTAVEVTTLEAPALAPAAAAEGQGSRAPPRYQLPPKLRWLSLGRISPTVLAALLAPPDCNVGGLSNDFVLRLTPLEYSIGLDPGASAMRVRPSLAAAMAAAMRLLCAGARFPLYGLEVQAPAVAEGMLLPPAAEPGAAAGAAGSVLGGHASWLAALGGAPLTHLALTRVALDAMDLMALVQHCPLLKALTLEDSAVSPAALPCLLGLPKLRWLSVRLSPSDAQDVILASLAQLALSPSSLEFLSVRPAEADGPWEAWVAGLDSVLAWLQAEASARGLVRTIRGA